jgi:transcription elongation factor Elf1
MSETNPAFPSERDADNPEPHLCVHCEWLGASAVVFSDRESTDILHCTVCGLSFQFVTEGRRIIVTQITPYTGGGQ